MNNDPRDFTITPAFDLSQLKGDAQNIQRILDSCTTDFSKFDSESIKAIANISEAMKALKTAADSMSKTFGGDMLKNFSEFDPSKLTGQLEALKSELDSLSDAMKKSAETGATFSQMQSQFDSLREQIREATGSILTDLDKLQQKFETIGKGININLNSPISSKDLKQLEALLKTVQTPVKTDWDVSSMVTGIEAITTRINDVDMERLTKLIEVANTAITAPEVIEGATGGSKPVEIKEGAPGFGNIAEINRSFGDLGFTVKRIVTDMQTGNQVLTGMTEQGQQITRVIDNQGTILRETVGEMTEEHQIAEENLIALKQSTAELERQATIYKRTMNDKYATPNEKANAQSQYDVARAQVQANLEAMQNLKHVSELLGNTWDQARLKAEQALKQTEMGVNQTMNTIERRTDDLKSKTTLRDSLNEIKQGYQELARIDQEVRTNQSAGQAQQASWEQRRADALQKIAEAEDNLNTALLNETNTAEQRKAIEDALTEAEQQRQTYSQNKESLDSIRMEEQGIQRVIDLIKQQIDLTNELSRVNTNIIAGRDVDVNTERQARLEAELAKTEELTKAAMEQVGVSREQADVQEQLLRLDEARAAKANAQTDAQTQANISAALERTKDSAQQLTEAYRELETLTKRREGAGTNDLKAQIDAQIKAVQERIEQQNTLLAKIRDEATSVEVVTAAQNALNQAKAQEDAYNAKNANRQADATDADRVKQAVALLDEQKRIMADMQSLSMAAIKLRASDTSEIEKQLQILQSELDAVREVYAAMVQEYQIDESRAEILQRIQNLSQIETDNQRAVDRANAEAQAADAKAKVADLTQQVTKLLDEQYAKEKMIGDLTIEMVSKRGEDYEIYQRRIEQLEYEASTLREQADAIIQENHLNEENVAIRERQNRLVEQAAQLEERIASAQRQNQRQIVDANYKVAVDNLKQQTSLISKIADYDAKAARASSVMKGEYQARANVLRQELDALQQNYNLIDQTGFSLEQQAGVQEQITRMTETTADAQLKVKEAVSGVTLALSALSPVEIITQTQITMIRTAVMTLTMLPINLIRNSITVITNGIKEAVDYCEAFYDKMNEIRVVTGMMESEATQVGHTIRELASEMSASSLDMADAAIMFYRQGLNGSELEARLQATTEYAKAAKVSFNDAAEYITASVNSIGVSAERVADVFLYLGTHSASSGEEIGSAMQKAAATANDAGLSFEQLGALISTVSEKTRQDAFSIGTALNSMMARLMQVKAKGYNDEDETTVNDIAKALHKVNIELTDGNGEWRSMWDIFQEISKQWDMLDDKTQNYLATTIAATRQANVFRVMMSDLAQGDESKTMELYAGAMEAAGTAAESYRIYLDSLEAAQDRMAVAWERVYGMGEGAIVNVRKFLYEIGTGIADVLSGESTSHAATDFSASINSYGEMISYMKALSDEYSTLANKTNLTEQEQQRMDEIVETLTRKYPAFKYQIEASGTMVKDTAGMIKEMNKYLADQLDLLDQYKTVNYRRQIMDAGKAASEAKDAYEMELYTNAHLFPGVTGAVRSGDVGNVAVDVPRQIEQLQVIADKINLVKRGMAGLTPSLIEPLQAKAEIEELFGDANFFHGIGIQAWDAFYSGFEQKGGHIVQSSYENNMLQLGISNVAALEREYEQTRKSAVDAMVTQFLDQSKYEEIDNEIMEGLREALSDRLLNDASLTDEDWADGAAGVISKYQDILEQAIPQYIEKYSELTAAKAAYDDFVKSYVEKHDEGFAFATDEAGQIQGANETTKAFLKLVDAYVTVSDAAGITVDRMKLINYALNQQEDLADETARAVEDKWKYIKDLATQNLLDAGKASNWKSVKDEANALITWYDEMFSQGTSGDTLQRFVDDFLALDSKVKDSIIDTLPWMSEFIAFFTDDNYDIANIDAAFTWLKENINQSKDALKDFLTLQTSVQVATAKKTGFASALTGFETFIDNGQMVELYNQLMEMAANTETKAWYDAVKSFFGEEDFNGFMYALATQDSASVSAYFEKMKKTSEAGTAEVLSAWETFKQKQEDAATKTALQSEKYGSWLDKINEYIDNGDAGGLFEWWGAQAEDLREDFYQLYPTLQPFLDAIDSSQGENSWLETLTKQFKELKNNLPTADDAQKLKDFWDSTAQDQKDLAAEKAKAGGYAVARGKLLSYTTSGNRADIMKDLSSDSDLLKQVGAHAGNADMTIRPVLDQSKLEEAGWQFDDGGRLVTIYGSGPYTHNGNDGRTVAFGVTPVLPNGEALSPEALDAYIAELQLFDNWDDAVAYDAANKNLLLPWMEKPEGAVGDEWMKPLEDLLIHLHELHGVLYDGGGTIEDLEGFKKTLEEMFLDGSLAGLEEVYPNLKEAIVGIKEAMADESLEGDDNQVIKLIRALMDTEPSWTEYAQTVTASTTKVSTQISAMRKAIEGIQKGNIVEMWDDGSFTSQEKAVLEATQAWKDYVAGEKEAADATGEFQAMINNLNVEPLVKNGDVWDELSNWMQSAAQDNVNDYADSLSGAGEKVIALTNGIESLVMLQQGLAKDTQLAAECYKELAAATGIAKEELMSQEGLAAAESKLRWSSEELIGTLNYLYNELALVSGRDFSGTNWKGQLQEAASSANEYERRLAEMIQRLNEASGKWIGEYELRVTQTGTLAINTGSNNPLMNFLGGIGNAVTNFVSGLFKSGSTGAQTTVARSSGGGGGGGSSSGSSSKQDNTKSDIEKMIDMMSQMQEFYEYRQSLFQEMRDGYEQDKLLQGVIRMYQQESDAITANNYVLEDNIAKIEALLPTQQKLVASMSTTDENYKTASSDLKRLQDAHQKYSKQLMENQNTLKKYQQAIDDTYKSIRKMEIDLRNTILQAIEDREELQENMMKARISIEDEVFDIIKGNYEKERDLILDNAKARRDALSQEKALLDENLQKRKEQADAEDKQNQLLELQQKYKRISADPTRRSDQLALQKEIQALQKELAWDEAEKEVDAQKDSIDAQMDNLDDYMDYVKAYYEDLFTHPQKLIAETEAIMANTNAEILEWLKLNNEEFANSTETCQASMVQTWEATLQQMAGEITTHWEEVEAIIQQGDEAIIDFLKENSAEYRAAGSLQAEAYVDEWKTQLDELKRAYQQTFEEISSYSYSYIPLDESSSSSYSGSSGGGGGGGGGTTYYSSSTPSTKTSSNLVSTVGNVVSSVVNGVSNAVSNIKNAITTAYDKIKANVAQKNAAANYEANYISSYAKEQASTKKTVTKTNTTGVQANKSEVLANLQKVLTQAKAKVGLDTGGYTGDQEGMAYLHRKERVLSAYQTELFEDLVQSLHTMARVPVSTSPSVSWQPGQHQTTTATFGDINVYVENLDTEQDYDDMADHVMSVISERMGVGRAVGGITTMR